MSEILKYKKNIFNSFCLSFKKFQNTAIRHSQSGNYNVQTRKSEYNFFIPAFSFHKLKSLIVRFYLNRIEPVLIWDSYYDKQINQNIVKIDY